MINTRQFEKAAAEIAMELELTRVELLQTGLTGGRTMRLLPGPGGKNQQRVAVGDDDGVVQVALGLQIYQAEIVKNGHIHDTFGSFIIAIELYDVL